MTANPERAAIFCDVDGTLAPIVSRPEDAHVPEETSRLLGRLARRYGCVACVSGRSVADVRRLVGVGGVAYAGSHGAELLEPGSSTPRVLEAFNSWERQVKGFVAERDTPELRAMRIRIEDKGPIMTFHWRGAPDEDRARTILEGVAQEAETAGLAIHWGRKVLEIRPPVPVDKGQAVRDLVLSSGARTALFGGDDVTDLDGFSALAKLVEEGALEAAVRVGVRSDEGPPEIIEQADLVVDGIEGFQQVLAELDAA
ncbi:MAG TPA: trehalose-phosphatase [Thermoleophilaceae bacterium]|nr:trehalose-phosphatase [Thermoleophilaceae bacterium]